jgi:hypothetical protein
MNAEFIFQRNDQLQHLQRRQFQIALIRFVLLSQDAHTFSRSAAPSGFPRVIAFDLSGRSFCRWVTHSLFDDESIGPRGSHH